MKKTHKPLSVGIPTLTATIASFDPDTDGECGRLVGVISVEKIPLTGMGKNDYRALEKEYYDFDYTQLHKK